MARFISLSQSDVTIEVFAEQSHAPVRGNALESGDDDYDRQVEDDIIRRANGGDVWAWADVEVRVSFEGVSRSAYLDGCCYGAEFDFIGSRSYCYMVKEALADLNDVLKRIIEKRSA